MSEKDDQPDYDRPVAYDANGQPLYAHPPKKSEQKSNDDEGSFGCDLPPISDDVKLKHKKSQEVFPELELNEGDYVIAQITRSLIGLFLPILIGVMVISLAFIFLFNNDILVSFFSSSGVVIPSWVLFWAVLILIIFVFAVEYITYIVFVNNKLYLTNESVIQHIQDGLFSYSEHIISLANIEDASYTQNGILQQMFNYGSIRLSTQGDETTYRITFISNPKESIATLDCAVENFKNYNRNNH